jgi:hypothetical protein
LVNGQVHTLSMHKGAERAEQECEGDELLHGQGLSWGWEGPNSKGPAKVVEVSNVLPCLGPKGAISPEQMDMWTDVVMFRRSYFSKVMVPNWSVLSAV